MPNANGTQHLKVVLHPSEAVQKDTESSNQRSTHSQMTRLAAVRSRPRSGLIPDKDGHQSDNRSGSPQFARDKETFVAKSVFGLAAIRYDEG